MAYFIQWAGAVALSLATAACSGGDKNPNTGVGSGGAEGTGGGGHGGGVVDAGVPDSGEVDSGTEDASQGDAGPPPDPSAPLFEDEGIPEFDITLTQAAMNALNAEPKTYVEGELTVLLDGSVITLGGIGVRLKGNYGSLRTLAQKAAFLLNFDKFKKDQTLFGLEKLALNNMVQDGSMIHESLAYSLFRAAGVPAPRSAYAKVRVNGELYGLYAAVETTDNPLFLKRWFGDDTGSLYEGAYGSDLENGWLQTFDQDNGPNVGYADLQELVDVLDSTTDPDLFVAEISKVIDFDSYINFAATEIFLGHWDGYAWTRNNFFLYRRPDDGRWAFIPWGIDQTFDQYLYPWGGDGRLQRMCDASMECRQKLKQAFVGVIARAEQLDLSGDATALKSKIWSAAMEDPRKEADMGTMSNAIDATIDFLKNRPIDVNGSMICMDPADVDNDNDGYSGCDTDCNDANAAVHPGAPEPCDLVDNDCNGVLDDGPMCPVCPTKPLMGGGLAAFCLVPRTYQDAELDCVVQGGHLISVHNQATQDFVAATALQIVDDSWWIGLNDRTVEGAFEWTDKTPLDYNAWGGGEPNDAGGNEDCGHLASWAGGFWNDIPCDVTMRYICALP